MKVKLTSLFELHGKKHIRRRSKAIFEVDKEWTVDLLHYFSLIFEIFKKLTFNNVELADNFKCKKLLSVFFLNKEHPSKIAFAKSLYEFKAVF